MISLCRSTAEHRPFTIPSIPAYFGISLQCISCKYFYLMFPSRVRPCLILLSLYGHQSFSSSIVFHSSNISCPSTFLLTTCTMSSTQALALIQVDLCLNLRVIPNIALSMVLCIILITFSLRFFITRTS